MSEEEVKDPAAVLAELRRAQEDLKELRKTVKSLEEQREGLEAQVSQLSTDEMRLKALKAETKLALQGQGIKNADRLIQYIGTDGLDFGENGEVTGLNERMTVLKKDLPEIFDPKVRAGGKADIFANDSVDAKEDPLKTQVHRALNGD